MDEGELMAKEYFESLGLVVERFTKKEQRSGKTPDFRVLRDGSLCFYTEVKTIAEDDWLGAQLRGAPPLTPVGGSRPDPTYNRLSSKVHEAAKQFEAVNLGGEYPNVLVFVNFESMCTYGDLLSVLTGLAFVDDGSRPPIFRHISEGRISRERDDIDLYLWIGLEGERKRLFNTLRAERSRRLGDCLGVDLDTLPQLV